MVVLNSMLPWLYWANEIAKEKPDHLKKMLETLVEECSKLYATLQCTLGMSDKKLARRQRHEIRKRMRKIQKEFGKLVGIPPFTT